MTHQRQQSEYQSQIIPRKSLSRLFPGPAGLLTNTIQPTADLLSQNTATLLEEGPWKDMSEDLKVCDNTYLHDHFNIGWIKKQVFMDQYLQKVPFLAGVLISLEVSGQTQKSVYVTLKDQTGTITGNILYILYEQHTSHLTPGSVLTLVQAPVLSCTCGKCDNHHLTITPKSLCAIYSKGNKLEVKKIDPQEVLKNYSQQEKELALSRSLFKNKDVSNKRRCTGPSKDEVILNRNSGVDFKTPQVRPLLNNSSIDHSYNPIINSNVTTKKLFTFKKFSLKDRSGYDNSSETSKNVTFSNNSNNDQDNHLQSSRINRIDPNDCTLEKKMSKYSEGCLNTSEDIGQTTRCDSSLNVQPSHNVQTDDYKEVWHEALNGVDLDSFFDDGF